MLTTLENSIEEQLHSLDNLQQEIARVIVGQKPVVEQMLICLLAGGHALLEGVPGLGKTLLVKTLADASALDFKRVQFTPDLMPGDILGSEILEEDHSTGKRFLNSSRARFSPISCSPMKLTARRRKPRQPYWSPCRKAR